MTLFYNKQPFSKKFRKGHFYILEIKTIEFSQKYSDYIFGVVSVEPNGHLDFPHFQILSFKYFYFTC